MISIHTRTLALTLAAVGCVPLIVPGLSSAQTATTRAAATRPAASRPAAQRPQARAPQRRYVSNNDGRVELDADERGNRIPDYSYAGYMGGARPIPDVPAKLTVTLRPDAADDNSRAIQAAIDQVGKMPADADGIRGAVVLPPGTFKIGAAVTLKRPGVTLRGSGAGEGGTTLVKTRQTRSTIVQIRGRDTAEAGASANVTDRYVPVNADSLTVGDASGIHVGDFVSVTHPCTREWIEALNMTDFGGDRSGPSWRPGSRDVVWLRQVTKVDGNRLTFDAPLTLALDASLGTAHVSRVDAGGLVTQVGLENLRILSEYDKANPKDEEHAWFGVGIENARDVWVRRVTFEHLAGSAVAAWDSASRVTVEECKSLAPVGEVGGWRRNAFFTMGQQTLFARCYSENAVHDFSTGLVAAGPNAFVECESMGASAESGPIDSAACGTLFDRVRIDGQALALRNRTYKGQGVGWASLNGTLWNCDAPLIAVSAPPEGMNYSFGCSGEFDGDGVYSGSDDDVSPDSLYYGLLAARKDVADASTRKLVNLPPVQGTRAPTLESAAEAIEISMRPRKTVSAWIDELAQKNPIKANTASLEAVAATAQPTTATAATSKPLAIENGWITVDGKALVGGHDDTPWWTGGIRPDDLKKSQPALTRFVPGRAGLGLTDDLTDVANGMVEHGSSLIAQHPPLWYERRRDDHERVQRMDGDVVAPFYETPWERSGTGVASDGLSKWDVTRPNVWYFSRLREFADHANRRGLVLLSGMYMQHNVLEAGAHYADAPWRPRNNVNDIGIPEPVFFAGDKLIYVAKQFYDLSYKPRAEAHRANIRMQLDQLADKPNVLIFLGEEFTGPLAFTQGWLDTIAEWRKETGRKVTVALYATKDVTDAVLADPKRAAVVDVIYNRFNIGDDSSFWMMPGGQMYAPEGGKDLSPRQWYRLLKPKNADFEGVWKVTREYRTKYPDKPFVYHGPRDLAWAVLLGGGSLAEIPARTDPALLAAIVKMKPTENGLADDAGNALVYAADGKAPAGAKAIDMKTGQVAGSNNGAKLFWVTATK